jgi:hypothetical protein
MLPKIDVPIYDVFLPLLKKKVRFRPFLVKEEKILLMAMESDEDSAIISAIKQIVENCCLDDLNIDSLPVSDLEFFFLNLRARSINEVVELSYKCNNKIAGQSNEPVECGNVVNIEVNVLSIQPEIPEDHTNKIELSEKMGLMMRYPSFRILEQNSKVTGSEIDKLMDILLSCIDSVYTEEEIFYTKDVSKEELVNFVENLTREQFSKIQNFFDTMPKIKKEVDFSCTKCGHKEKIGIEGLQNFFV